MNEENQVYFVDSDKLPQEALARKHRLEQDASFRTNHMEYMEGMQVIDSDIKDKVLAAMDAYDYDSYTAADVERALSHESCTIEDFKALLSPAAAPYLEQMARKAEEITKNHFGNTVYIFTPLYIANYCQNYCIYCGFNCYNNIRRKKLIGGKNAYTSSVIAALFKGMKNQCRVTVDGKLLNPSDKILLCTVANGQYVGGSFRCAPRSVDCDGLLEVCLVRPVSRIRFMQLIKDYTNGTHLDNPKFDGILEYCRGKRIDVEAPEGFIYSFDGELVTQNNFTIEVAHRAIRFAVPWGAKPIVDPKYITPEAVEV